MGLLDFLSDPILLTLVVAIAGGSVVAFILLRKPKGEKVRIIERIKPGFSLFFTGLLIRSKAFGNEMVLNVGNRKFIIPEEKQGDYETVQDIKGRQEKLWLIEKGQVVQFADELYQPANPLMDHQTTTSVINRTSAKRLSSPKLPKGDLYLYLVLGAIVGIALGWILYPSFNHPAPVVEYYKQLPNGTFVPFGGR